MSKFTDADAIEFLEDIGENVEDHVSSDNTKTNVDQEAKNVEEVETENTEEVEAESIEEVEAPTTDSTEELESEEEEKESVVAVNALDGYDSSEQEVMVSLYNSLFKDGIKANGVNRVFRDDNHVVSLIQQGLAYSKTMERVKPLIRHHKSFESAGITLDDEKVSLVIDLLRGKKEAISHHIKELGVDFDDLMDNEDKYSSNVSGNIIEEKVLELSENLEEVKGNENYDKLIGFMNPQSESGHKFIQDNPSIISNLVNDMESGYFDTAMSEVAYRKDVGSIRSNVSDIEAYVSVMQDQDFFNSLVTDSGKVTTDKVTTIDYRDKEQSRVKPQKPSNKGNVVTRKKQAKQHTASTNSKAKVVSTEDVHKMSLAELDELVANILGKDE